MQSVYFVKLSGLTLRVNLQSWATKYTESRTATDELSYHKNFPPIVCILLSSCHHGYILLSDY